MEVKKTAKDAMLAAIEQERDGDQIDRSLLKNVLGIFIEVGSHICHTLQSDTNVHYTVCFCQSSSCPVHAIMIDLEPGTDP